MNTPKQILISCLLLLTTALHSQRANTWCFGNNAGLNFNPASPTPLANSQVGAPDNRSCISDVNGNLQFYTDGISVWDNTHSIMPNGGGLTGHASAGQCALIIPIPCSQNRYVIFHITEFSTPGHLKYSVVDMSLNGGLGDVVVAQKNVSLGTGWTEKLCAYYNPIGNNYWVLTHKWNSNDFVAFDVNATSIATNSVVSSIGSVHSCGTYGGSHDGSGQLTISPDGTKVLNALTCQDKYELFQFNSALGTLSNSISIPGDGFNAWGTAFSPNSQLIYTSTIFGQKMYQYNIITYNQSAIIASQFTVATITNYVYTYGYLELGPNNRLYVARPNLSSLSVINNPNNIGIACGFIPLGQNLGTKTSSWGLSRIAYNIPTFSNSPASLVVSANNVTLCTNASNNATLSASATFSNPVSYLWQPVNIIGQNINVNPISTTIYTVTATASNICVGTATLMVTVTNSCCSLPVTNLTSLANMTGTLSNASYFLGNNITLSGSTYIKDAEVLVMPGVNITVPPGMVLDLDHVHLYACGLKMWQGIVVQDGGQIRTSAVRKFSSLIEDAVVAIDVDGITVNHASPPIDINNVVFNKNYTGIKLSNSTPAVTTLPINVTECVFTSRNMPFTSPAPFNSGSWQTSSNSGSGLRVPFSASATQGLVPPYQMSFFTPSNIKWPYNTQFSQYGIQIKNIGNQSGTLSSTGVDMGITYPTGINNFNLFDNLEIAIDVENASLTTMNNIIQGGGYGINHKITSLMNAKLDLRSTNTSTTLGNLFWNCWVSVYGQNIEEVKISHNTFRSTRNTSFGAGNGMGAQGVILESNRFNYDIEQNEFNNIDENLTVKVTNGSYDLGAGLTNGTYAGALTINQNYFGPEVTSNTAFLNAATPEYCGYAITLNGINGNNWQLAGHCNIFSNKIDRAYRGIRIDKTDKYPVEIGGNNILIFDDNFVQPGNQYGIYASNTLDNLVINQNDLTGQGINNQWLKLIHVEENTGSNYPIVSCNKVHDAFIGFEFSGFQPFTTWSGSEMHDPMTYGFSLTDFGTSPGEIGQQGSASQSSGNYWMGPSASPWTSPGQFFTRCVGNSNPLNSVIYPDIFTGQIPTHNGVMPNLYTGATFIQTGSSTANDCLNPVQYPTIPSQRSSNSTLTNTFENSKTLSDDFEIYPNPTNSSFTIKTSRENEVLSVRINDLTGKLVYSINSNPSGISTLDISSLKPSVYILEIQNNSNKIIHKKLIKTL